MTKYLVFCIMCLKYKDVTYVNIFIENYYKKYVFHRIYTHVFDFRTTLLYYVS